jgi:hypothetical protein
MFTFNKHTKDQVKAPMPFYSFVITIERVSIDSRGAAPSGAFGLTKETCGQT